MNNKLGISESLIQDIEEELVKFKSKMFDYRFTFGVQDFGIIYLLRLHEFLFGDLYYDAGKMSSRYQDKDKGVFDAKIKTIVELIKNKFSDTNHISELIDDLINDQIFEDGNSRTISLFFDNVINCFYSEDDDYSIKLKSDIRKNGRNL